MPEPDIHHESSSLGAAGANPDAPDLQMQEPQAVDPLAAVIAERDEYKDRLLRSHAELDNFRKRLQRERDEERRYAVGPIVRDLLPVLDNLQRAVAAAERGGTIEDLRQGMSMVLQQSRELLAKHQVHPISAVGQPFDPNRHEALTQMPSADQPAMTVLQEVEGGYTLHDRVLRPTKVIVSSGPPNA
jgi:molecular chaperone GrpE